MIVVSDLPTKLNLGCGPDYRVGWHNLDHLETFDPDQIADIEATPWDLPDGHFSEILLSHVLEHVADQPAVLEECERVLMPGGTVEVQYPIGQDFVEDPDHVGPEWDWRTPERLCGRQPWDVDVGLKVIDKEVDVWAHDPGWFGGVYDSLLSWREKKWGDGRWQFDTIGCTSGELRVWFRKPRGDDA